MRKIIVTLFVFLTFANTVKSAQDLELSDIIKQAREAAMQEKQHTDMQKSIQQVKNEINTQTTCEQTAAERINPNKIIDKNK